MPIQWSVHTNAIN